MTLKPNFLSNLHFKKVHRNHVKKRFICGINCQMDWLVRTTPLYAHRKIWCGTVPVCIASKMGGEGWGGLTCCGANTGAMTELLLGLSCCHSRAQPVWVVQIVAGRGGAGARCPAGSSGRVGEVTGSFKHVGDVFVPVARVVADGLPLWLPLLNHGTEHRPPTHGLVESMAVRARGKRGPLSGHSDSARCHLTSKPPGCA